jgi:hypothetical protein
MQKVAVCPFRTEELHRGERHLVDNVGRSEQKLDYRSYRKEKEGMELHTKPVGVESCMLALFRDPTSVKWGKCEPWEVESRLN